MKRRVGRLCEASLLALLLCSTLLFGARLRGAGNAAGDTTNDVKLDPAVAAAEAQEQERQALRQALDELRQQVNTSSRQILDQSSKDAEALSRKVQDTLSARLDLIERTLAQSQQRELDALRASNKTFLTLAGLFAGLGVLGILIAALILARSINRFSEVTLSLPGAGHALSAPADRAALGPGEPGSATPAQFEQVNARFSEALERLEKRIREIESWNPPALPGTDRDDSNNGHEPLPVEGGSPFKQITTAVEEPAATSGNPRGPRSEVSMWLGKGQALLNLGKAEEALACFNQAIALDPRSADAFVKKGMVMERLQKMDLAIENYDQAIAVNDAFTLAYLYKGAVCNKLQRFQEALDCYERALRSEQTSVTA